MVTKVSFILLFAAIPLTRCFSPKNITTFVAPPFKKKKRDCVCPLKKKMRSQECEFSHFAIHPGHGRRYVPFSFLSTKPVLAFSLPKCFAMYKRKKNPRFTQWTRTYRRIHRKTTTDRVARRRPVKVANVARAIVGADLSYIQEVRAKHKKEDRSAKAKAVRAEVGERKLKK